MSGIKVLVLLQIMFQLMVAGQEIEDVTLPSIENPTMREKNDSLVLPRGYVKFPELGFAYKMSHTMLTHHEAREMCLRSNGQLAVIHSMEQVNILFNHFAMGDQIHVGLSQDPDTEEWITVDGKSTNNLPWAFGEPRGAYRCAKLSRISVGLYNFDCLSVDRYLCEIALPKN